jgi:hypothetical protein
MSAHPHDVIYAARKLVKAMHGDVDRPEVQAAWTDLSAILAEAGPDNLARQSLCDRISALENGARTAAY